MNVGSLFSGIGGIELGFEAAGFKTSWFVENEPYARAVLRKHWNKTPIYGDITKIDFNTVPPIDILTGGFPCQDISNAGKRAGIKGDKSSLWKYYLEAIRILRPKYAVIENVSAILNRGLDVVLADLASIRYNAEWHCISASSIGANHRRDRIIIIAYPDLQRCMESGLKVKSKEAEFQAQRNFSVNLSGATRPKLCRAVDGLSAGSYRIKCLGNAVVPQFAQIVAEAIKEVEDLS